MITAIQVKRFITHLYPEYSDILSKLTLYYRKIDIGERYCYDIQHEGENIPLIAFRIDLDKPDIKLNTNILQLIKYNNIKSYQTPISYSILEDWIRLNRDELIEELIYSDIFHHLRIEY